MAFPTTGILDDFTRADAPDLGANWTAGIFTGEALHNTIVSNHAEPNSGSARTTSWWNVTTFGASEEAYLTLFGDDSIYLYVNLQAPGTAGVDGYQMFRRFTNVTKISRIDNGVATDLGADITTAVGDGSGLGLENVAGTLSLYQNTGSWALVDSRSDSTYGAGSIGFGTLENGFGADDFGGGTVVEPFVSGDMGTFRTDKVRSRRTSW